MTRKNNVFLKPMSYFSLLRVQCDENKCVHCGKCLQVCPMNVEVNKESRKRKNGTECIRACLKIILMQDFFSSERIRCCMHC